jgi:hypothetical protein
MTWTLFLDDIRFPEDVKYPYGRYNNVIICRSFDDAVWTVKHHGAPNFISFDHDLADVHYITGDGEKTGYTFAKWFCDWVIDNDVSLRSSFDYYVHSMNPVGAENIRSYMRNFLSRYRDVS